MNYCHKCHQWREINSVLLMCAPCISAWYIEHAIPRQRFV